MIATYCTFHQWERFFILTLPGQVHPNSPKFLTWPSAMPRKTVIHGSPELKLKTKSHSLAPNMMFCSLDSTRFGLCSWLILFVISLTTDAPGALHKNKPWNACRLGNLGRYDGCFSVSVPGCQFQASRQDHQCTRNYKFAFVFVSASCPWALNVFVYAANSPCERQLCQPNLIQFFTSISWKNL